MIVERDQEAEVAQLEPAGRLPVGRQMAERTRDLVLAGMPTGSVAASSWRRPGRCGGASGYPFDSDMDTASDRI